MEDLITELKKSNLILNIDDIRTGLVLFADDIIILCKSSEDLNNSLRICDEYGIKCEITIANIERSKKFYDRHIT
jgi:hypothetical protein